jgi:hypothetical protein
VCERLRERMCCECDLTCECGGGGEENRRPSWEHYTQAFRQGDDDDEACNLHNLSFLEEDLRNVEIQKQSYVVCVHACNELNKLSVSKAVAAGIRIHLSLYAKL